MTRQHTKAQRLECANALIKIISEHGRRFFYYGKADRIARFFVDPRGYVRYQDEYSGEVIYPYQTRFGNRWRGFSHGGTLRWLVEAIREYISTGKQLSRHYIGPQMSYGDMWGYGENAIAAVREAAFKLPIFPPAEVAP